MIWAGCRLERTLQSGIRARKTLGRGDESPPAGRSRTAHSADYGRSRAAVVNVVMARVGLHGIGTPSGETLMTVADALRADTGVRVDVVAANGEAGPHSWPVEPRRSQPCAFDPVWVSRSRELRGRHERHEAGPVRRPGPACSSLCTRAVFLVALALGMAEPYEFLSLAAGDAGGDWRNPDDMDTRASGAAKTVSMCYAGLDWPSSLSESGGVASQEVCGGRPR